MAAAFGSGVLKLSLLGQSQAKVKYIGHEKHIWKDIDTLIVQLTDCSEVIPQAKPFTGGPATLPPGLTMNDIEQAVSPFPKVVISTQLNI